MCWKNERQTEKWVYTQAQMSGMQVPCLDLLFVHIPFGSDKGVVLRCHLRICHYVSSIVLSALLIYLLLPKFQELETVMIPILLVQVHRDSK